MNGNLFLFLPFPLAGVPVRSRFLIIPPLRASMVWNMVFQRCPIHMGDGGDEDCIKSKPGTKQNVGAILGILSHSSCSSEGAFVSLQA